MMYRLAVAPALALSLFVPTMGLSAPAAGVARTVSRLEKPPRLPVWPVVNGLFATALDLVGLGDAAAYVEDSWGGRVAPMMLDVNEADPFVLLVHHRHAFDAWDPIRPLFRLLLPEGFPAHPHVGFETVTMTLKGGLAHRDSTGLAQQYGDGDVQWLTAASGVLHEEMWLPTPGARDCELYQLWLNLPAARKKDAPKAEVLRAADLETRQPSKGVEERRLGGDLGAFTGVSAGAKRDDALCARVFIAAGAAYEVAVPQTATALVYVRKGHVIIEGTAVPRHHLAYTDRRGEVLRVENAGDEESEVLVLCALPLREPVVASGTWVVTSQKDVAEADRDYQQGKFGTPWPHTLSDEEWQRHTRSGAGGRGV
ncbi:RmlC-like cupin domain-containing protein [Pelagophyceae sp. CCMP2097]|nr:RmlC-like cupin domain-containing protein [Pelagophyceae sp. CCMP2097]